MIYAMVGDGISYATREISKARSKKLKQLINYKP